MPKGKIIFTTIAIVIGAVSFMALFMPNFNSILINISFGLKGSETSVRVYNFWCMLTGASVGLTSNIIKKTLWRPVITVVTFFVILILPASVPSILSHINNATVATEFLSVLCATIIAIGVGWCLSWIGIIFYDTRPMG